MEGLKPPSRGAAPPLQINYDDLLNIIREDEGLSLFSLQFISEDVKGCKLKLLQITLCCAPPPTDTIDGIIAALAEAGFR